MNDTHDDDFKYKVLLIGESSVGKTSIIRNLKGENFMYSPMCTIGVEYTDMVFTVGKTPVKLQIWDTAGQERFRSLTPLCYRGCKALIFVYDLTSYDSYKNLKSYWLNSAYQNTPDESAICTFLVGNKVDASEREVTTDMGISLQHSQSFLGFYETSALTGENINNLFHEVAKVTHQHHKASHKPVQPIEPKLNTDAATAVIKYISKVQCKQCRKKMLKAAVSRQQIGRQSIKLGQHNNEIAKAARIELVKESKCCS